MILPPRAIVTVEAHPSGDGTVTLRILFDDGAEDTLESAAAYARYGDELDEYIERRRRARYIERMMERERNPRLKRFWF